MKNVTVRVLLNATSQQRSQLRALQVTFAQACNSLMPLVRQTGCWNRVALHHMAYRALRTAYPALGSQMACNVIYSVSRTCRVAYQHPASPVNLQRLEGGALPNLQFLPSSPVYFDRHTLSLRDNHASLFTLDGRIRFSVALPPAVEQRFRTDKLRETILTSEGDTFVLTFHLQASTAPPSSSKFTGKERLNLDHVRILHTSADTDEDASQSAWHAPKFATPADPPINPKKITPRTDAPT